jgi:hypothetical protein
MYKMAKLLVDKGILVGLENSGDMNGRITETSPFLQAPVPLSMD